MNTTNMPLRSIPRVYLWLSAFFGLLFIPFFWGCEDLNPLNSDLFQSERERDQKDVLDIMNRYYYWYQEIPDINSDDYSSVPDVFQACLWTPEKGGHDSWSFILTKNEYKSWVEQGQVEAYGVTFVRFFNTETSASELRVGMTYRDSPMDIAGIERGFRLEKLNGVDASDFLAGNSSLSDELSKPSGNFLFTNSTGNQVEKAIQRASVTLHPADQWTVFERAGRKIGYLMFTSFMVTESEKEVTQGVFDAFKQAGIDDLILDLRYNGGGDLNYSRDFSGFVVPASARDDVFIRLFYNDKVDGDYNKTIPVKISNPSLSLPRLVVITSAYTASASESVVMGLSPYMNVVTVGTTTAGKPAGMNGFIVPANALQVSSARWVMFPISFLTRNKLDEGEYYDGIVPDFVCADDVLHPFNANELCIKASLDYLENGSFLDGGSLRGVTEDREAVPLMSGFRSQVGLY